MSTWSEARTAIKEFEYPVVGDGAGTQNSGASPVEAEVTEEMLARRESCARQLGRQEGEAAARADYQCAVHEERAISQRPSIRFARSRTAIFTRWRRR
jgi:hypothetical protein